MAHTIITKVESESLAVRLNYLATGVAAAMAYRVQTRLPQATGAVQTMVRFHPLPACGCGSVVEHHVANVRVVGSNPTNRSILIPI